MPASGEVLQRPRARNSRQHTKYVDLLGDCAKAFDAYSKWIGTEKFDSRERGERHRSHAAGLVRHPESLLGSRQALGRTGGFHCGSAFRSSTAHHSSRQVDARKTASNLIGELSGSSTGLHKSPDSDWRKPPDYDDISHRPIELESDLRTNHAKSRRTRSINSARCIITQRPLN